MDRKPITDGIALMRSFQDYMAVLSFLSTDWHRGVQALVAGRYIIRPHYEGLNNWSRASDLLHQAEDFS